MKNISESLNAINKTTTIPNHFKYTDLKQLQNFFVPIKWERQHVIVKELLDNALDAVERTNASGRVSITLTLDGIFKVRNPGEIQINELKNLVDFTLAFTSKSEKMSFQRGSLGFGLRIAIMLQDLESHPFKIRTGGKEFEIRLVNRFALNPKKVMELKEIGNAPFRQEVEVEAYLPSTIGIKDLIYSFVLVNPHIAFNLNIYGEEKKFKRTARSYKKDIRLDLYRYKKDSLKKLIQLYKYTPMATASLFISKEKMKDIERWLPESLKGDQWWEHGDFSKFEVILVNKYKLDPVKCKLFGEKALKSRLTQVFGVLRRNMRYESREENRFEFVRFKGKKFNVVSINGTVLPPRTVWVPTPWDKGESVIENLIKNKEEEGIIFIYQTTSQIFKGEDKMRNIGLEFPIIAKLIVPRQEREVRKKNLHRDWINPKWLEDKKSQGYRDQKMKRLFPPQHEGLSLLTDEIVPLVLEYYKTVGTLSLRQIYYLVAVRGWIFNNPKSSKNFNRLLTRLREWEILDYGLFEDRSRKIYRPTLFSFDYPPEDYCNDLIKAISPPNLDIWENQDFYVEVWVEKEALLPLLRRAGEKWRISTFALRGFASRQKLFEAYQHLNQKKLKGKTCIILYMGDLDPSGIAIFKSLKEKPIINWRKDLIDFVSVKEKPSFGREEEENGPIKREVELNEEELEEESCQRLSDVAEVKRIGLTVEQVEKYLAPYGLFNPDAQEVKETDSRTKSFLREYGDKLGRNCYELDALPPEIFLNIIDEAIQQYFDPSEAGDEKGWIEKFNKYKDKVLGILKENRDEEALKL